MGNRRSIVLSLAAASVIVMLAGCTGGNDASSASPSAAVVSPSTSTPTAESSTSSPAPDTSTSADAFVGSWGTVDRQSPHLVIASDGTFTGSDGCNTLRGTWELEDDGSIEFDDVAMTRMACEGVDQTLNRLDSATVTGDDLTVFEDHHDEDHDDDGHDDDDHHDDDVITLITLPRTG